MNPNLSHAEWSRTLMTQGRQGTLATLAIDPDGYPYPSLVQYSLDSQGNALLLLSNLPRPSAEPSAAICKDSATGCV